MLPARVALIVLAVPVALGAVLAPSAFAGVSLSVLSAKPDLVLEQIYSQTEVLPDGAGGSIVRNRIYVDIGNWGNADAAASELHFRMRDLTGRSADAVGLPDQGYTASGSLQVAGIDAGETLRVEIPQAAYSAGNSAPGAMGRYHLLAVADGANALDETIESNNALEADVFGGEAKAT